VPILIRPTAPVAADALLPGDPARAMALAQVLLDAPRMSNHAHGLWGYHGHTATGRALTIQATGVGGASGAMVLADLAELGTRRAVPVGPCVSLAEDPAVGDLLVVERALATDGTSAALGADRWAAPDPGLFEALRAAGGEAARPAAVASVDLLWDPAAEDRRPSPRRVDALLSEGAVAAEMQAAALLMLGARLGLAVGCLLVVSDAVDGPSGEEAEGRLAEASARAGRIGARALRVWSGGSVPQESSSEAVTPS
jgi:uridine phosphorylase